MSSQSVPPFPSNIPTASISTISYNDLLSSSPKAIEAMLSATQGIGFFFLSDHPINSDSMFDLASSLFQLPPSKKMEYDMGTTGRYFGYKRQGASVVDAKGTPDTNEFYNIPKDDILGVNASDPLPQPSVIANGTAELQKFMQDSHAVVRTILQVLESAMGLPSGRLLALHQLDKQSGDQARLTHAPPIDSDTIALGEHTDFGSVTILFNRLGGLQALAPVSKDWMYVKPVPGCALINLGDALVQLLGRRVYSGLHRVMGPPGEQAKCSRYSVVYFARPNGQTKLRSLMDRETEEEEGKEVLTADEWIRRRATMRLRENFRGQETIDRYKAMEYAKGREVASEA